MILAPPVAHFLGLGFSSEFFLISKAEMSKEQLKKRDMGEGTPSPLEEELRELVREEITEIEIEILI